jgi:hypothetical protein
LFAEVLASTGAVCRSALVYTARHRNLMISIAMLGCRSGCFALILGMRALGWPPTWAAAGPAVALAMSVTMTSVIKARVLSGILNAPVSPFRWPLLWAAGRRSSWAGPSRCCPSGWNGPSCCSASPPSRRPIYWCCGAGPLGQRTALFGKAPSAEEATLPHAGGITR